jgi:hypothetical protein
MRGFGSRKGTRNARMPEKRSWMETVRPLRKLLRDLRDNGQITRTSYSKIYMRIKGGAFRNKSHLMLYLKENEFLQKAKPVIKKPVAKKAPEAKESAPKTVPAKKTAGKEASKKKPVKNAVKETKTKKK